jgi:hypothetical protein
MSQTTKLIDYQKLHAHGKSATLMVKMMIACIDLQLANEALSQWKGDQPRSRADRQPGARMYFTRLQIAHLFEAYRRPIMSPANPSSRTN